MSYHARRALAGSSTVIPVYRRPRIPLGSLGADEPSGSTLSDPTLQWQTDVLAQLRAGVATLQKAELQKWLQIAATLAIPLSAAIWKAIFKKGASESGY